MEQIIITLKNTDTDKNFELAVNHIIEIIEDEGIDYTYEIK